MTSCSILSRLSSFLSRLISSCLSLLLLLLLSPLAGSRGSGPPSSHHWLSTHLCGTASWAHELSPATPKTSSHFQNERSRWSYFKLTTKTTWICAPCSSHCGLTVSHMTVTVMLLPTTLLNEYCNTSKSLQRVHSQWPTYSYIHVMLSSEKMRIADVNVFTCVTHKCFSWGTLRWKQMYFFFKTKTIFCCLVCILNPPAHKLAALVYMSCWSLLTLLLCPIVHAVFSSALSSLALEAVLREETKAKLLRVYWLKPIF